MIFSSTNCSNSSIFFYIFLGIFAVALFLIIFFSVINKKKNDRVLQTSPYINEIKKINRNYNFKALSRTSDYKIFHLGSKRAFDIFDYYKRRNDFIKSTLAYYQQIINKIDSNISLFAEYKKELSMVRTTSDESLAKENKMSLKSFKKREIKLGNKLIKNPQMTYSLRIEWEYTSPAGRNHYSYYKDCSFSEIKSVVQQFSGVAAKTRYSGSESTIQRPAPRPKTPSKVYSYDDIEDIED